MNSMEDQFQAEVAYDDAKNNLIDAVLDTPRKLLPPKLKEARTEFYKALAELNRTKERE